MATCYGVSPWIDAVPAKKRPAYAALRGEQAAPLVIIGGGLTGLMTAYAAAAAGLHPVLLEADRLGQGGSGRASGICAGEAAWSFVEMQAASGRRVARAHFDHMRRAVLDLAATVRRLNLKCDFDMQAAVRLVPRDAAVAMLRKDVGGRREAGLEASWLTAQAALRAAGAEAEAGARLAPWAVCDPYRLALGFARAAEARGVRIFERSAVTKITFDRAAATVCTEAGRIVTPHVVHATGEPSSLVAALGRHVRRESRGMVLSAPLPVAVRKALGTRDHVVYDTLTPPHAVRWTPDHRVMVCGRDAVRPKPTQAPKVDVPRTGELMYELTRLYPDISGVLPSHGWSLPLAYTADGGLLVGPHRNFPHQLFAFGTLHDPARAYLASRILLRHLQESATADDARVGFGRTTA